MCMPLTLPEARTPYSTIPHEQFNARQPSVRSQGGILRDNKKVAYKNKKLIFLISLGVLIVVSSVMTAQYVSAIAVGNTIQFTANTNIRSCASASCGAITIASSGSTASVIGGPQYANGYQWWNVRLSSGTTGLAVSNWMIVVSSSPPTLSVSVNPSSITAGQSTTFSWSSSNATSCTGSRGGSYPTSGSFVDYPSVTTTYGLTCTGSGGSITRSATVTVSASSPPVVAITSSASSINAGQSVTLGWGTSNATSCTGSASPADSNWSGSITPVGGGSRSVSPTQTTTYTLSCSGPGGSASNSVTITVIPPVGPTTCTSSGSSSISKLVNQSFTINWCAINVSSWSASGPGLSRSGGAVGSTAQQFNSSLTLSSPGTYIYNIVGNGATTVTRSMVVTISSASTLTINLSANPTSINTGQSSTLTWSTTNATSCSASGGWSCGKSTSGSESVSPGSTTTYTLNCSGPSGNDSRSVTVTVSAVAAPTVNLSANPTSINTGQSSTLTWSTTNATSCSASGGWSGGKSTSGSESVSPGSTTTYTLNCSGPSGSASRDVTVTVLPPVTPEAPPSVEIRAD